MSLNTIQLPPVVLQRLYKQSLIELKSSTSTAPSTNTSTINILGKNLKHIVIVVSNTEAAFLPDEELNFLLGILSACKLNMEDVGIVNLQKNKALDYTTIETELSAEKIFLFGVSPEQIQLPLAFPDYQVQQYKSKIYLTAPPLPNLQDNKAEKGKLWTCLKQIFSI